MLQYWTSAKITTQPAVEPVTVDEVKTQLRLLDFADHDTIIALYIAAARQAVEGSTGRQLITATRTINLDFFPGVIYLPYGPIQTVDSISYFAADNTAQTLSADDYDVDDASILPRIVPAYGKTWPSTLDRVKAVTVTYKAGYGNLAASVPAALRQVIISLAIDLYEHPEANTESKLTENKAYRMILERFSIRGVA